MFWGRKGLWTSFLVLIILRLIAVFVGRCIDLQGKTDEEAPSFPWNWGFCVRSFALLSSRFGLKQREPWSVMLFTVILFFFSRFSRWRREKKREGGRRRKIKRALCSTALFTASDSERERWTFFSFLFTFLLSLFSVLNDRLIDRGIQLYFIDQVYFFLRYP